MTVVEPLGIGARIALRAAAVVVVLGLHAAAIAFVLQEDEDDAPVEDESGAFFLELAPVTTTIAAPVLNLPPGPASVDSVATPASAPQEEAKPITEPDVPPLPVSETAEPEIAKAAPEEKPPEETKETEEPVEQKADAPETAPSVAAIAAAPPSIEDAPVAAKSAAPVAGTSERNRQAMRRWQNELSAHLNRFKRFPAGLKDNARSPDAILVKFTIDREGKVGTASIQRGSGSDILDEEARKIVLRASPVPVPPQHVFQETMELVVPVVFKPRR